MADRTDQVARLVGEAPDLPGCGVRVAGFEDLLGQRARLVVLTGLANGLVPSRAALDLSAQGAERRARERTRALRRLYGACACAREAVVGTTFEQVPLEEVGPLGLDIGRVRLRDGRRVAVVTPSVCCAWLRGETPMAAR